MLTIRRANDRGRTRLGWLDSRHTFSFGEYHDENHMGFHALRVISDDRVAEGDGEALEAEERLQIAAAGKPGEALVFELA